MNTIKLFSNGGRLALADVLFLLAAVGFTRASTLWTGPNIGFYHAFDGLADEMTTNVIITRGSSGGLYNSFLESGATAGTSPAGTLWAQGLLANYNTLSYGPCPLEQGNSPGQYVGSTFVVHLLTNDIYLELTLTNWGGEGGAPGQQTFGYTRSTPAVVSTPVVTITNPVSGAVFAAPANVNLSASATNSSGSVTNVQFFANNSSLGSVTTAPFSLTASGLGAGPYTLTAVATSGGILATSAVVNITVVTPLPIALSPPTLLSGPNFQFSYSANVGLSYVVQRSTSVQSVNWVSLATNVAASNPAVFVDSPATNSAACYRVGLLPNP
jgi:hypothetical protein